MSKKLILFGNGNNIECIAQILELEGVIVDGFCVDDEYYNVPTLLGKPIYKFSEIAEKCPSDSHRMFSPMSGKKKCQPRKRVYEKLKALGYEFYTFISQKAHVYTARENIGENVFIGSMVVIQPKTLIKDNVYLGEAALIAHDVVINKHSYVAAASIIAGGCVLEECVFLGINAIIRSDIKIVTNTMIGMGVRVHEDITESKIYVYSPIDEKHFNPQKPQSSS